MAPIGEGSGVDPDEIELGVVVQPRHWGKGIAAEAGLAVAARLASSGSGCERVYAGVDPTNEKSLRVVAKAPGVRKVDDELYELTAEALARRVLRPGRSRGAPEPTRRNRALAAVVAAVAAVATFATSTHGNLLPSIDVDMHYIDKLR